MMLTGDSQTAARAVARKLGIDEVDAEVLPPERLQRQAPAVANRRQYRRDGRRWNQRRPALAQAEVGIAMGTGTDMAIESAGITLVKGDLRGIVRAPASEPSDDAQHPAESVFCFHLQCSAFRSLPEFCIRFSGCC